MNKLSDITKHIQNEKNSKVDVFCVPGNHDCHFSENSSVRKTLIDKLTPENIDDDYKVLVYLLDKIIEKYKNKEYIPKKLSYAFLDISNCFDLSEKLYSEAELNHIEDLKNSLYEKLVELYES